MELWPCGFKIEYTHLGFASAGAVWLGIWNSDHVVLKSIIRTSASPWRQRSHWGVRVTQDAYFSLLVHTKQLLFVTFCDTLARIEVSFWPDGTGTGTTDGWTDKRGSRNSYLDLVTFLQNLLKRQKDTRAFSWLDWFVSDCNSGNLFTNTLMLPWDLSVSPVWKS